VSGSVRFDSGQNKLVQLLIQSLNSSVRTVQSLCIGDQPVSICWWPVFSWDPAQGHWRPWRLLEASAYLRHIKNQDGVQTFAQMW